MAWPWQTRHCDALTQTSACPHMLEQLDEVVQQNHDVLAQVQDVATMVKEMRGVLAALTARIDAMSANLVSFPAATPSAATAAAATAGCLGSRVIAVRGRRCVIGHRTGAVGEEMQGAAAACLNAANMDPRSMKIAELKAFVTDNGLDDDEYYKIAQCSKTKKADWVCYVQQKLHNAAG